MAEEVKYNNTLVSGRADETLTYTKYVKDESSGKSAKELLDEKVNKTDQLGTTQIADKAVTTEKLENESVTTDKLDAASVTTDKVADANITTSKLADSSVETEKINNKAVTTDKLNDGAVDNSKLSPEAVTYDKVKNKAIITEKLNDRAVTTEKVEERAITNPKLGNQSVDGRVVREASLENKHFANGSVTTEKIKDGSVTNEKIADDTLGIEKFDPEFRKTIQAATGLPEDLVQTIQNVDKSIKQLHENDTNLQSQVDDNQQKITANKSAQDAKNASLDDNMKKLNTRDDQITETLKNISATGGASVASAVTYDNTTSQLTSANIQGAVDELQGTKIDKTSILQESGEAEDKVMSQKAVSDKLSDLFNSSSALRKDTTCISLKDKIIKKHLVSTSNGIEEDSDTYDCTDFIPMDKSVYVTLPVRGSAVLFDSNKKFIKTTNGVIEHGLVKYVYDNNTIAYIRINQQKGNAELSYDSSYAIKADFIGDTCLRVDEETTDLRKDTTYISLKNRIIKGYLVNISNGLLNLSDTYDCTDFIPVNKSIYVTLPAIGSAVFYDSNKKYIKQAKQVTEHGLVKYLYDDDSIAYIRINQNNSEHNLSYDNSYVIKADFIGNTCLEAKEEIVQELGTGIDKVLSQRESSLIASYNSDVINYRTENTKGYLNIANTFIFPKDYISKTTGYIKVKEGDIYLYKGVSRDNAMGCLVFDKSFNVIKTFQAESRNDYVEFIMPKDSYCARFSSFDYPNNNAILEVLLKSNSIYSYSNNLSFKNWIACGDSFTHGDFTGYSEEKLLEATFNYGPYSGQLKVYPFYIGNRVRNFSVKNEAKNGLTLRDFVKTENYKLIFSGYNKIDYITLYFGINDSHQNVTIGTIDDTLEDNTFYGYWNTLLTYLITNFTNTRIGIIVSNGLDSSEYSKAERAVAKKYGIPYLDFAADEKLPYLLRQNERSDVSQVIKNIKEDYFAVSSTNRHPNEKAHNIESDFIEQLRV